MQFLQAIKSDLSLLIVGNKTGGTIRGDIYIKVREMLMYLPRQVSSNIFTAMNGISY